LSIRLVLVDVDVDVELLAFAGAPGRRNEDQIALRRPLLSAPWQLLMKLDADPITATATWP
jgi:hypothetical protein